MSTTAIRESELRGGRWLYAEPSPQEVRDWFELQPLHDGMSHDRYASGVVLIPNSEKTWRQHEQQDGSVSYLEEYRRIWTPYVSVSTRVNYFWDYVRNLNHGRLDGSFGGEIEPVDQNLINDGPLANAHLPNGFSQYAVMQGQNLIAYVVCTMRVTIRLREGGGAVVSAEDSRQVPAADPYALMKARTAAVGRALGLAGMLVIGTGVASAEEVQDSINPAGSAPADFSRATLPDIPIEPVWSDKELRDRIKLVHGHLSPAAKTAFDTWYSERAFGELDSVDRETLDIIYQKVERDADADGRS